MFLKSVASLTELPDDRPHVAIIGRSNVGKSSLLNALAQQKNLARVSAEPGRTQTLNFFQLEKSYYLVDLPGYGFAKTSRAKREEFAELILGYLGAAPLALVVVLVDGRHGPSALDRRMLEMLARAKTPTLIVATKADKLTRQESVLLDRTLAEAYPRVPHILSSSQEGTGRGQILDAIAQHVKAARRAA